MAVWSSYNMQKDGQTDWLVRLYEKTINGLRSLGGLPSEALGVMTVEIPTLAEQTRVMRPEKPALPGQGIPSGVIEFLD